MKTVTINTFQYDELSAKAKEVARDWYRKGLEFQDDFVIEDATTISKFCGFEIKHIHYSGFCCQGDGASFTGRWRAKDVAAAKLKEHAPQDEELHRIVDALAKIAAEFPYAYFMVDQSGHYSHEYCTDFTVAIVDENEDSIDDTDAAEKELIDLSRRLMRWIYRQLEKDYEYQNSDEAVVESIEANEYEFTAEGRRNFTL